MGFRPPVATLRDALALVVAAQCTSLAAKDYAEGLRAATVASELRLLIDMQLQGDEDPHGITDAIPTPSDDPRA